MESPGLGREVTRNAFLDALSPASLDLLLPHLTKHSSSSGDNIASIGLPITEIVFPIRSVLSVVTSMRDGSSIEVTIVGLEGFHGISAALGDPTSPHEAMVQIADGFWSIPTGRFLEAMNADAELSKRMQLYVELTLITIGQLSACNRLHAIHERAARWLLMAHDRVETDTLLLTHEYLAVMLGVRRPGVSIAAEALERAGYIEYRRGKIKIRDRAGLESAACECYSFVNDHCVRLMGYDIRKKLSIAT